MERPLAFNRDAVALALFRPIIPERQMLRAAVVPKRDRIQFPLEPHLELRLFQMRE